MVFVVAALASQVIALIIWGRVAYLWVQGLQALVAAVAFTAFAVREPHSRSAAQPLAAVGTDRRHRGRGRRKRSARSHWLARHQSGRQRSCSVR